MKHSSVDCAYRAGPGIAAGVFRVEVSTFEWRSVIDQCGNVAPLNPACPKHVPPAIAPNAQWPQLRPAAIAQ